MDNDERRRFSRLPFRAESALVVDGSRFPTRLMDISIKGALVSQPEGWPQEGATHPMLEIRLEDSNVKIHMQTEVVHFRGNELGLACLTIDVDSMTHLRRLVELNLGDPNLVERELSALG